METSIKETTRWKKTIEIENDLSPVLSLIDAVGTFYVLEELQLKESPLKFSRAPEKLIEDIKQYQEQFGKKLARTLFDYLALASFGEARHAFNSAGIALRELDVIHGAGRNHAYVKALAYDPSSFLEILVKLFNGAWVADMGGKKWKMIAQAALEYINDMPLKIWIDHVVDLSHNNGYCFNKGILLIPPNGQKYKTMLDKKTEDSVLNVLGEYFSVDFTTARFIDRAVELKMIPEIKYSEKEFYFPQPIKWGEKKLSPETYATGKTFFCANCGNEEFSDYGIPIGEKIYCGKCVDECTFCHKQYLKGSIHKCKEITLNIKDAEGKKVKAYAQYELIRDYGILPKGLKGVITDNNLYGVLFVSAIEKMFVPAKFLKKVKVKKVKHEKER